jgi:hypothetical protein
MEIKVKHNIPFITIINARMKVSTNANVLQHNEYMVKSKVGKMYFYLNNMYGVDMMKVQIKNPNLHLIIIVSIDKKAMLLWRKMYRCID